MWVLNQRKKDERGIEMKEEESDSVVENYM